MEIITGVERRRRWRVADKLRILAELEEPGVRFNDVARRHDLSRGLLCRWRDAHRCGQLVEDAPVFVPVLVAMHQPCPASPTVPAPGARPPPRERTRSGRSEVVLPDGMVLRIDAGVNTAAPRGVLAALIVAVDANRALWDPLLTVGLPPTLTAGTGVDALIYCIEAFFSTAPNPLIDLLALDGTARI